MPTQLRRDPLVGCVRLIPFNYQVQREQRDTLLREKLYAEKEGILVWLMEGCRKWQQNGALPKYPESWDK